MSQAAAYRKILSDMGVCDDRIERAITDLLQEKDTALELERLRVSDREWKLENQLMKERMQ